MKFQSCGEIESMQEFEFYTLLILNQMEENMTDYSYLDVLINEVKNLKQDIIY